jgi:hypothetical protein
MRRPWPSRGCCAMKKKMFIGFWKMEQKTGGSKSIVINMFRKLHCSELYYTRNGIPSVFANLENLRNGADHIILSFVRVMLLDMRADLRLRMAHP